MYIRVKKVKNSQGKLREYLLVVEGKRIDGKVRQRVIANLGRVDILKETDMADLLVEKLTLYTKQKRLMDIGETQCDYSKEYGLILILRRIWEDSGLEALFKRYLSKYKYKAKLSESIFAMVVSRIINPASEYKTSNWIEDVYEPKWDRISLQHFYRGLDFIERHKVDFEKELFLKATDLFSQELDLVMFDTTSIKYWGEGGEASILQRGYSKEKRGDLKQVIVGILMTKEGLPIGCEIFPGNTSDLKSFIQVVEKIKGRYKIGKIIWVADRGMVSKENIRMLNELKQEYILGVRMRQFDKAKRKVLLSLDKMWPVREDLYVKEVKLEGEGRYIVCYNPKEQELEFKKRQFFKLHLRKKIATAHTKEWIIKNGYKKYVDFEGEITLNEEKLRDESQYDGKWVLLTNSALDSRDVALYYKGLWQIEASFRDLKQDLETSPIYHYKQRRIIAHIFVSFLSLLLKTILKKKIRQIDKKANYTEILEAVKKIKAVKLSSGRQEIIFRTELPQNAYLAFKAAGISPPPKVLHYKDNGSVVPRQG